MARFLSPVLSAQFMTPIPTLILNLTSSWSLSWTSSCPSPCLQLAMLFLPAVGPLFPAVVALFYPLWVRSFHLPEILVGAAVNSSLFSTVRTCVRSPASPLSSAELTLPVHHRTFSHVLYQNFPSEAAHHTPSHRLRLAEPPHALSRATRGLGNSSPTLRKTPPSSTVRGDE